MDECVHESLARGGRHGHGAHVPGVRGTFQHIGHRVSQAAAQPAGCPALCQLQVRTLGSGRDGPWIDAEIGVAWVTASNPLCVFPVPGSVPYF